MLRAGFKIFMLNIHILYVWYIYMCIYVCMYVYMILMTINGHRGQQKFLLQTLLSIVNASA